jgi:hypothetical protein
MQPTASQGLCTIELVEETLVLEELRQISTPAAACVSCLSLLFTFVIMFLEYQYALNILSTSYLFLEPTLYINHILSIQYHWRTQGGCLGGSSPPRNSEVLKKLGQIPSFVEYTSVTT